MYPINFSYFIEIFDMVCQKFVISYDIKYGTKMQYANTEKKT